MHEYTQAKVDLCASSDKLRFLIASVDPLTASLNAFEAEKIDLCAKSN